MSKITPRARPVHGRTQPLPLFDYADRHRWDGASLAARMVRRRAGIESPATARAIAEAAGFSADRGQ